MLGRAHPLEYSTVIGSEPRGSDPSDPSWTQDSASKRGPSRHPIPTPSPSPTPPTPPPQSLRPFRTDKGGEPGYCTEGRSEICQRDRNMFRDDHNPKLPAGSEITQHQATPTRTWANLTLLLAHNTEHSLLGTSRGSQLTDPKLIRSASHRDVQDTPTIPSPSPISNHSLLPFIPSHYSASHTHASTR